MRIVLITSMGATLLFASGMARADDARDKAVAACMAEAKTETAKTGATDVTLKEVEDTDKLSEDRAAVRALVYVLTTDEEGKQKKSKKTFKCETQNGVVTSFKLY